jgi:hypothetical protein
MKTPQYREFKSNTLSMPVFSTKPAISGAVLRQRLSAHYSPHSFGTTGITKFSGKKPLRRIAGHANSRTTKLCDRRSQKVLQEHVERIRDETQIHIGLGLPRSVLFDACLGEERL